MEEGSERAGNQRREKGRDEGREGGVREALERRGRSKQGAVFEEEGEREGGRWKENEEEETKRAQQE